MALRKTKFYHMNNFLETPKTILFNYKLDTQNYWDACYSTLGNDKVNSIDSPSTE